MQSDGRVETSDGIIPANNSGIGREDFCQRNSLPFAPRDTTDKLVADYDRVSELVQNRNNRDMFDLPLVFLVWGIPKVSNIRDKRFSAYSARFSLSSFLRGSFKYRAVLIVSSTVSRG